MEKAYLSALLVIFAAAFFLFESLLVTSKTHARDSLSADSYVQGELLVKFKNQTARGELFSIHDRLGATLEKELPEIGWQQVRLPEGFSVSEAVKRYKQEPAVADAQPNFIYRLQAAPNDPDFTANKLYGMAKINAPVAWDVTTGNSEVVVAILDTGINYNHEDLVANIWKNSGEIAGDGIDNDSNGFVDDVHGYNFVIPGGDNADDHSHGSHCAGTIGGVGNNGKGVVGVNWNVKMLSLKTHDGVAGASTSMRVISAFQYVTMMKGRGVNIRVTSNSYGGPPEAAAYDQALKDAIDAAGRADILNVFAAGNDNFNNDQTPTYPSAYNSPSIIAVAASDQNDNKASFSSYGATAVDVAAPGVGIWSTILNQGYGSKSGTSMATPHVAGAAALLAAAHPSLSAASLKATLLNTVDVLPQWSGRVLTGGRINVASAIQQPTVCTFNSTPVGTFVFTASGGNGVINVTAPNNCGYTGFPSESWITANPSAGNGQVTFTVAANASTEQRSATIEVAGQTFSVLQSSTIPTAAKVEISGRVLTETGRGAGNVWLELSGGDMFEPKFARTNQLGYYRFSDIAAGHSYTITARSKRYSFNPAAQTINLSGDYAGINFTASQK
ncbi:MAG: S8 family serine peptidase [Acidobacteriota bacterium]|nr:S8 family serine peptidase [Acidobacteriota bacterium]